MNEDARSNLHIFLFYAFNTICILPENILSANKFEGYYSASGKLKCTSFFPNLENFLISYPLSASYI